MSAIKVGIRTLGCKVNQYDSSAIEDVLREEDILTVPFSGIADVYIINTCTVTGRTDCESRRIIRKAKKTNPDALIIVTGCYAQVSSLEVAGIKEVDYVLGNPEKTLILDCIKKGKPQKSPVVMVGDYKKGVALELRTRSPALRTRANLKVEDGCNRNCSFCIIPRARGFSKSLPVEIVLKEARSLIENGFREIVLTGIHLGAYGNDLLPRLTITDLLKEMEKRLYPARLRISSLDPDEVTDELIDLLKTAKAICNHLHLPLQSGDDKVLRFMKRPYAVKYFRERVEKLHNDVNGISMGVDIIAGFPGEGEREFENTYDLIKDLPVSYLHIFPYSKREGTPAAEYPEQVNGRVVKERTQRLHELDRIKRREFYKRFLDKEASLLVESSRDRETGLLKGRTRNYIPVFLEGPDDLKKKQVGVILNGLTDKGMKGDIVMDNRANGDKIIQKEAIY